VANGAFCALDILATASLVGKFAEAGALSARLSRAEVIGVDIAEPEVRTASAATTCSVNSFTGSTPVVMADGLLRAIRDVQVGNSVVATDPETGETGVRPVTRIIVHGGMHTMVDVELSDGTTITATDRHPFWNATSREFTYAIDLRPGDRVRKIDGTLLAVSATRVYEERVTAYNLSVGGIHTYYAGVTPVLVHNSCGDFADQVANGHAWTKHAREFPEFSSPSELAEHIRGLMSESDTIFSDLERGRAFWYEESSNTIVIRDPASADLGTVFRPRDLSDYLARLK
jgi:hypothetical protein